VGDREKIEADIRGLNLGPIKVLDADGKPLSAPQSSSATR
jgi:hypothetical protein